MRKVLTIVGTRPELIKMSRIIAVSDTVFEHVLVHTGQNYDFELNEIFYQDLGIRKPDVFLDAAGTSAIETIANVLVQVDAILDHQRPDAVMIYGDTNSGLACIPAKRRKIPIFHMEAGNRSFDARVPEEINRKIIDHISDLNFVLTEHARRYLLEEGIGGDRIVKTGSHMREVLDHMASRIAGSDVLSRLDLEADCFFVVSLHREENVDVPAKLAEVVKALSILHETYGLPVIVSTHPRTRARLEALGAVSDTTATALRFLPPFGFSDYITLQKNAFCVISDSGTIAEEAALLNLCAVTVRDAHERPEGQDGGVVVLSKPSAGAIIDAVRVAQATRVRSRGVVPVLDYEVDAPSRQVVRVVAGYIDFLNEKVWSVFPRGVDTPPD